MTFLGIVALLVIGFAAGHLAANVVEELPVDDEDERDN